MSEELLRLVVRGKDRWEIKHEAERRAKLFFEDVGHTVESADVSEEWTDSTSVGIGGLFTSESTFIGYSAEVIYTRV